MNMFSPERPLSGGRPAALPGGVRALPGLLLTPQPSGLVEVGVMLPVKDRLYSWFTTEIPLGDLPALLARYVCDPERTLEDAFSWRPATQILMEEL